MFIGKFLKHSSLKIVTIFLVSFSALVVCGSRSGLLMIGIVGLSIGLWKIVLILSRLRVSSSLFFTLFFMCVFVIFIVCVERYYGLFGISRSFDLVAANVQRSLNFNLSNDLSSQLRFKFLAVAIEDSNNGFYVFGVGPLAASKVFFDGILSVLISHGGASLVFVIALFLLNFWKRLLRLECLNFTSKFNLSLLILIYIVSNIITEYIFVTRNMLLAICGITACFFIACEQDRKLFNREY
ncbi:hypothetical protein HKCCA1058_05930 [Rhodobacterales bacterium HKCCA1058]|nr:hypothetical protein [Rhodobacterales bacterium HKCCA1058]